MSGFAYPIRGLGINNSVLALALIAGHRTPDGIQYL